MRQRTVLASLTVAYLGFSAWMFSQEREMRRGGGPGIVGFELAGSTERAEEILAVWGPSGRAAARRSLLIDYAVLATYAPLMASLCRGASARQARRGRNRLALLGPTLVSAQFTAAACDVAENTALLRVHAGRRGSLPAIAGAAARMKFTLLAAGGLYVAASFAPERA
jgi:hypothetical protein